MGEWEGRGRAASTRAVDRGMRFRELIERGGLGCLMLERDLEARLAEWEAASAGGGRRLGEQRPRHLALRGEGAAEVVGEAARRGRVVVLEDDPEVNSRVVLFGDHALCMEFGRRGSVTRANWLMPTRDVEEGIAIGRFLAGIGEEHFSRARNAEEPLTSDAGREALLDAVRDVAAWIGVAPEGTGILRLTGRVGEDGKGDGRATYRFEGERRLAGVTGLAGAVMEALVGTLDPRGHRWVHFDGWDNVASSWWRRPAWETFPMIADPGSATLRRAALAGSRERRGAAAARLAARLDGWNRAVADQVRGSVA